MNLDRPPSFRCACELLRRLLIGLLLLLVLAACSQPASTATPAGRPKPGVTEVPVPPIPDLSPTPVPLVGSVVYSRAGNIWELELRSGRERQLTRYDQGSFAVFPSVSPDGQLVAFSLYAPSAGSTALPGTDLYIVGRDGSEPRQLLSHVDVAGSLEMPVWAPDGKALFYTYRAPQFQNNTYIGETVRIERVELDTAGRTPIIDNAANPAVSPDGSQMVWVKVSSEGGKLELWLSRIDGSDARRFVHDDDFSVFLGPAFSPDGQRVLFSAVHASAFEAAPTPTSRRGPLDWLGVQPRVATAHGIPWDIWTVNTSGDQLAQITDLVEDNPMAAWSPDGQHIAVIGEHGLYVLKANGDDLMEIAQPFGGAGIDWVAE